tara:strand:- start:46 stop:465 length:420 start_codon:yes stop_codon:yes gene_type:complete
VALLNASNELNWTKLSRFATFNFKFDATLEVSLLVEGNPAFRGFLCKGFDALFNARAILAWAAVFLNLPATLDVFLLVPVNPAIFALFWANFLEDFVVFLDALVEGLCAVLSCSTAFFLDRKTAVERFIFNDFLVARTA